MIPSTSRADLLEQQLEALYEVSRVLSRSLNVRETLVEVLSILHRSGGMARGMAALTEEDGDLSVSVLYNDAPRWDTGVRYAAGEGIVGLILAEERPIIIRRIADERRFLDRLRMYDARLPFIGVPIQSGENPPLGVLAAQPPVADGLLDARARFLQMTANLIARVVLLSREVEADRETLREERDTLRRTVRGEHGFEGIIGHTRSMRTVFEQVRQVARWNTTVLIRGESGTGKELIANAIHYNSPRSGQPFVRLNCAALPDNLLESELFGHEKGAFTGAVNQRKGRFEQAHGGTLFLDEIGEISPSFQAKLLRVLQEGEFERVGGGRTLKVDVRVIAATNRDLETEVAEGSFREDLYYRLNVMPIRMPPLRDRIEDVPQLSRFLVEKVGGRQGRPLEITDDALRTLMTHEWPGNVRELENTLERAAVMSMDGRIDRNAILNAGIRGEGSCGLPTEIPEAPLPPRGDGASSVDLDAADLDERAKVIAALEQAGWVQAKAARLLNMTPRQIAYRIQILDIPVRKF